MKKNLMSVIILALVLANLVLTALLVFTVLPETKKANEMIDAVCSAISLELNNGNAGGVSNIDQIETYDINGGEPMSMNLKSEDGKSHYAVMEVSLSLNKESDSYDKYSPQVLKEKESIIKNNINMIIVQHTKEELISNPAVIQQEILEDMQSLFGEDYVVGVSFPSMTTE